MADKLASFDFSALVAAIRQAHEYMAAQAGRAVNISLTLRNWVIGCYISGNMSKTVRTGQRMEKIFYRRSPNDLKKQVSKVVPPVHCGYTGNST